MNEELILQVVIFLGIFVGNAISLLLPYFRKLSEGKISAFEIKYAYHSIISLFWQTVLIFSLGGTFSVPKGLHWILVFILAVSFGYGGKPLQEQVTKFIEREKIKAEILVGEATSVDSAIETPTTPE